MEPDTHTEVAVIGGGPAGYATAIRAAQRGLEVTLIEREGVGGTCLNHGCIPSKALISATDLAHEAGDARRMGIHADPSVDVDRLIGWKDGIVRRLTKGVAHLLEKNGVTVIEGTARFVDEHHLAIDAREDNLRFDHAVIATGSRPIALPSLPFEEDRVLDSRTALAIDEAPDSLAIVGAGYIGMELAGVFAKLGSDVTVIELLESALPLYDDRLTRPVQSRAEKLGVDFRFGVGVTGMDATDDAVELTTDGNGEPITVDCVLVAVGREPVTDSVALEAAGIDVTDAGTIPVDEVGRTAVEHVFAVGDVVGDPMLAHAGIAEGIIAAETIADGHPPASNRAVPEVVFTDPEIAQVGMTEEAAVEAGIDPVVGEFPLRANGRSLTLNRREGFVRLIADASDNRIVGGAIVGPEASELIGEIALAVELDATLEDVGETIHPHPTLSEATMEAAEHALGQAIHRLN